MKPRGKQPKHNRGHIAGASKLHDRLAAFEAFEADILPVLRRDMTSGKSAQELFEKYSAMAAARGITIALQEEDSGKALAAIKDILDRTQGKAKESKEIEHKLAKLPDKELDAFLLTQINEMESDSDDEEAD